MKHQIIDLLGKNHTTPIQFDSINGFYGLYTFKGGVYVFKEGDDFDYEDLSEKEQKKILKVVLSKDWKLNKSLQ